MRSLALHRPARRRVTRYSSLSGLDWFFFPRLTRKLPAPSSEQISSISSCRLSLTLSSLQLLLRCAGVATNFVLGASCRRNAFCFQSFTSANTPRRGKYLKRPNVPFGCAAPGPPAYVSAEHLRLSG